MSECLERGFETASSGAVFRKGAAAVHYSPVLARGAKTGIGSPCKIARQCDNRRPKLRG